METITLETGATQAPQIDEVTAAHGVAPVGIELPTGEAAERIQGAAHTAAAVALDGAGVAPTTDGRPRYGYREDSPPEVLALLRDAQAGDTEAFGHLYRMHVRRITGYVYKRMRDENQDAVPDVVQDAFCEAFADSRNAHHDVTGWLLTHAAKAYIRHARSNRQQERAVKATKEAVRREYAHGYARQHPGTITAVGRVTLAHALAKLAPAEREVVQHRYLDGQTQHATAIAVGKTLHAVKSAEHRALKKMREGLARPGGNGSSGEP